jgi:DMSO/TMAO reductase YedYZ molybdopterin-dependent catalytic subunit
LNEGKLDVHTYRKSDKEEAGYMRPRAHLIPRKLYLENQEFPMLAQTEWVTPSKLFYIRNHFLYPKIDVTAWRLVIEGLVERPVCLRYEELAVLPKKTLPYKHGFPLRLFVSSWYGMASVKWLHRIVVIDRPFQGPFQIKDVECQRLYE